MRVFKIPFDVKREEKIFGGYLSLNITVKLLVITLLSTFLLLCTFMKINEQNFDKFFFYAIKYLFRKKDFVYERCCKW